MWRSFLVVILTVSGAAAFASRLLAVPTYSPWSPVVNLGSPINSPFTETGVALSKNGLSLYFSSNRPCDPADAVADFNLWVAHRDSREMPWGEPECLRINADARIPGDNPYQDREPGLSRDQHWLYFASDRPGSLGPPVPTGGDVWVSWRPNIFDDQGWTDPVSVIGLNTESREGTPHYFENDEHGLPQLFFSSTRSGFFDVWVADVLNGFAVGTTRRVNEVNTDELLEAGGSVTHDGLEMFLFRGRTQSGIPLDIYSATRPDLGAPWSALVNLGPAVNHATANEQEPKISSDRTTLFFASNRPGSMPGPTGAPSIDIWASARTWGGGSKLR
jgi:hypothetical protein